MCTKLYNFDWDSIIESSPPRCRGAHSVASDSLGAKRDHGRKGNERVYRKDKEEKHLLTVTTYNKNTSNKG